jgi:hypothetical protein
MKSNINNRYSTSSTTLALVALTTITALAGSALAAPITLRSGQVGGVPGLPGQFDDIVTYLPTNPPGGPVSASPFTPGDFAGAASGPIAELINAHPAWTPGISDTNARWINFNADRGGTAGTAPTFYGNPGSSLYAVPFFVPGSGPLLATLNLELAVDDFLGDWAYSGANPAGVYINGSALPLYTTANYGAPTTYSTTMTVNGGSTNYLYFYQRDGGVLVSGIIFSAVIDVVPTPGSAAIAGMAGLLVARRRR